MIGRYFYASINVVTKHINLSYCVDFLDMKMDQNINNTDKSALETLINTQASIWVFGYGSLTWKPDFIFKSKEIGYIQGYQRRFWQGNVTHRGTVNKPGRVATLVKSDEGNVWGVAYEVVGRSHILKALGYLNKREKELGGYTTLIEEFLSRDGDSKKVLVYTATSENDLYMGPCNMARIAMEIISANGNAGSNIEYVTRLAEYVRENIPEEKDEHLFTLEKYVWYLKQRIKNVECISPEPIIALSYARLIGPVRN